MKNPPKYPLAPMKELRQHAEQNKLSIAQVILANESLAPIVRVLIAGDAARMRNPIRILDTARKPERVARPRTERSRRIPRSAIAGVRTPTGVMRLETRLPVAGHARVVTRPIGPTPEHVTQDCGSGMPRRIAASDPPRLLQVS